MIKTLSDENGYVRWSAITVLGKIGPQAKEAVPDLIKAISDHYVREGAAEALGKIGPKAVPALIKALSNNNWEVRYHAIRALGRIGTKAEEAVPALIKAISDKNVDVRRKTAETLEKIDPEGKHYRKK